MHVLTQFRSLLAAGALFAATSACGADNPMACIKELAMPSLLGRVHVVPITIVARIAIGKGGTAKDVDYGDAKGSFRIELDEYFKERTRYTEACDGKTISFTIRYLVEGQKTGHPVWRFDLSLPMKS
jgi:hypothetical protein